MDGRRSIPVLDSITRALVRPRGTAEKLGWTALGVGLAIGGRWLVDKGAAGIPFVTVWPVLILISVFLGWHYAVAGALLCAVLAVGLFLPEGWAMPQGDGSRVAFLLFYLLSVCLIAAVGEILHRVVLESRRRADQSEAFNEELQHRTKNTLQIMRALIVRASRVADPIGYCEDLSSRLDALIAANELLGFGVLPDCDLEKLLQAGIRPFDPDRFQLTGPAHVRVGRNSATALMMAVHELCTNATKYGALSNDRGRVAISWSGGPAIGIEWRECDGPEVQPPRRRGMGSRILGPSAGLGTVEMEFHPSGVICRMALATGVAA